MNHLNGTIKRESVKLMKLTGIFCTIEPFILLFDQWINEKYWKYLQIFAFNKSQINVYILSTQCTFDLFKLFKLYINQVVYQSQKMFVKIDTIF